MAETSEKNKRYAKTYIAIDLKSFYASVECIERNLNPLTTNLVVADESRTDKTICLAVSPSLKAYGLSGRSRLFEVRQKEQEVLKRTGKKLEYIIAPPRMQLYLDYSQRIYGVYLKYISKDDIHVYSIDEVMMDVTEYLSLYKMTAKELTKTIIQDVYQTTGITATGGIGTNLYLCKVAMDIMAKHVDPDENGVRIAELDEESYCRQLWNHKPLRSFWRVGGGLSKKLEENSMSTMGDIAKMSLLKCYYDPTSYLPDYKPGPTAVSGEDFLFKLFGIDAEILIDHAWGLEPTTMKEIKNYKPSTNSIASGQVLGESYTKEMGRLVVSEMIDEMVLGLVSKKLKTNHITMDIGYDNKVPNSYTGELKKDRFGKTAPKPAHGSVKLKKYSSSTRYIMEEAVRLYDRITNDNLLVHRFSISFDNVIDENDAEENSYVQMDLFSFMDHKSDPVKEKKEQEASEKERKLQEAMLSIKGKYGKNALLKGMNLREGATMKERNGLIGGHKA